MRPAHRFLLRLDPRCRMLDASPMPFFSVRKSAPAKSVFRSRFLAGLIAAACCALNPADSAVSGKGDAIAATGAGDTLRIGSKRFTESYILAQILAQSVDSAAPVEVRQGLGNTAIVYEALRAGSIDLYPEYAGTINLEILQNTSPEPLETMRRQLAVLGLGLGIPLGFNNGYALAVREADAEHLGIRSLSELARHREFRFGLSNEFIGRADGWRGLARRYGFTVLPTGLDHGLAYDAIAKRQIDVIDIYTTDARIGQLGLRVLKDDLGYFPRYDALVLYRLDVPKRFPRPWQKLMQLSATIDEAAMIRMNARAELNGVAFDVIARDYLAEKRGSAADGAEVSNTPGAASSSDSGKRNFWRKLMGPDLARLTMQHLALVAGAVIIAACLAIPLAIVLFPHARLRAIVLGATGLLQTVPSLALLAILISLMGRIGALPALLALILYALLPIMRNTCVGLAGVPPGLRQAAQALGLSTRAQLLHIDLPLALPTIIAGVRTATAISIGTATIAAFIGAGGYGERIVTGLALNDRELLLAGAFPAALLALASELLFETLESAIRRARNA